MLPEKNTPWPPRSAQSEKLAEWSAWYSGDVRELGAFYGARQGAHGGPLVAGRAIPRPSQYAGGIVGAVARMFWGVPPAAGEQQSKLHVPLAADICGTSADLLFADPVQISTEDKAAADLFAGLREDGLDSVLHEGAEVAAAMSGAYLRTVWDEKVSPRPWTEICHPDGAVPTWNGGRLTAVTLWSELPQHDDKNVTYRLLERHEVGSIEYGLYAGTPTNLGLRVPLTEHPQSEHLAVLVDEDGLQATGLSRLAVVYVPNMRPNRLDRHSAEGRSDLQGVEPWLDALDEAYSSWWRDIRHGKSRIHVPAVYLESDGPGQGAVADIDREVYVPLQGVMGRSDGQLAIEAHQFKIRVEEHKATCEFWTTKIIESAGYSTQSLSGSGSAVTAAEVHSHERRSYMTRDKKTRYWTKALREHLRVQLEVAGLHLRAGTSADTEFSVAFSDGVQDSAMTLAQTAMALRNAESASAQTRVKMVHPDWTDEQVTEEAGRILAESGGAPLPDPMDAGL